MEALFDKLVLKHPLLVRYRLESGGHLYSAQHHSSILIVDRDVKINDRAKVKINTLHRLDAYEV